MPDAGVYRNQSERAPGKGVSTAAVRLALEGQRERDPRGPAAHPAQAYGEGDVARRLLSTAPANIAVPTVVVHELETGIAKSKDAVKRRGQLDQLLHVVAVLPFGIEEAKAAAALRARLDQEGTPIGPMDTRIAGTALAHRGVLVTRNVRELGRVPGLSVQNWYGDDL